ncbi:prepilin peptidase [Candidatus Micrarchaeota archaeon]|nr:prepilin peptidase [Candidatus Micrarchaeota archaeon]
MDFILIRLIVALAGTAIAAKQDWDTSFIDEKLLYAMAAIGLLLNAITLDAQFILFSVGGAAVIFAIGYLLYKTGKLGGGDVWLFVALQLLLPFYPFEQIPAGGLLGFNAFFLGQVAQSLPFFVSVLIASSVIGMLGSSAYYAYCLRGKKLKPSKAGLLISLVLLALLTGFSSMYPISLSVLAIFALILLPSLFITVFREQVNDEVVIQSIPLSKIEDEDVLAIEKIDRKLVKKYSLETVLTANALKKLRKMMYAQKLRVIPVYKVLPRFAPYVLLGLIACLLARDLLVFLLLA